jgi:hypothetical protein
VKIGNPTTFVNGDQHYRLHYSLSSHLHRGCYALNLIGFNWDITINNVTFSVKYPFLVKYSEVSLFSGIVGTFSNVNNCEYSISESTVVGHCLKLPPRHGVTVSVQIPNYKETFFDRFNVPPTHRHFITLLICFVLSLFLVITIFVYTNSTKKSGNHFDLHPAEAARLLRGRIRVREAIVRLMDRGYVSRVTD